MSFKYTINGVTLDDKNFGNLSNVSIANAFRNMGKHYDGVAIGAISESVTINAGPVKATGTITIAVGNMADADTITINGVVLTAKTTPTTAVQFKVGSSALQTGINLQNCINANAASIGVHASYAKSSTSAVVTTTALGAGTSGNYTWSQSGSNVTLSPASALAGGANGPISATATITSTGTATAAETMSVCNQTLTAETSGAVPASGQFNISGTVGVQAASIALAINSMPALSGVVTATSSLGVVTVTAVNPGIAGNGLQISEITDQCDLHAVFGRRECNRVITLHKGI